MKYFLQKLKESTLSLLPIALVVLLVHFIFAHIDSQLLIKFFIGLIVLDFGEALFLLGIDSSVMKMGNYVGETSSKFSNFFVTLFFGFLFGILHV